MLFSEMGEKKKPTSFLIVKSICVCGYLKKKKKPDYRTMKKRVKIRSILIS